MPQITLEPNPKQHLAWKLLEDHTTTELVFGGGAGGGKSWLGCEWLIVNCLRYPDTRYFIARKTLKNLKKTTLRTFFKVAKFHGLKRDEHYVYNEQSATITFPETGAIIDLLEVKLNPSDPDFEDLGSSEYTAGWLEEAGEIDFGAYDTLSTRIGRQMNDKYNILGKLYITCNPKKNWLYTMFYKPWKEDALPGHHKFLQALIDDNPKNEAGYKRQLLNIKDPVKRQRLLLGNWEYDDDPNALMDFDALADLFTNTVEESEEKYLTCDAARFGGDFITIYLWRGFQVYRIEVYQRQALDVTKARIRTLLTEERIPYSHAIVDEDGVGGGLVDELRGIKGFVAASSPLEPKAKPDDAPNEQYANLKAQCSYMLAAAINGHQVAVATDHILLPEDVSPSKFKELLIQDLEQVKRKDADDDTKKLQIVSKKDVKEILQRSPDFGDALMFRMFFELQPPVERHVARQYRHGAKKAA